MITIVDEEVGICEDDKECLHQFVQFCLNEFVSPKRQKQLEVRVVIRENYLKNESVSGDIAGELTAYSEVSGRRKFDYREFDVELPWKKINKKAKSPKARMKVFMKNLAHEMVHLKQYANGELRDLDSGEIWFKGEAYQPAKKDADYWRSPWELEAWGWMEALYSIFNDTEPTPLLLQHSKV